MCSMNIDGHIAWSYRLYITIVKRSVSILWIYSRYWTWKWVYNFSLSKLKHFFYNSGQLKPVVKQSKDQCEIKQSFQLEKIYYTRVSIAFFWILSYNEIYIATNVCSSKQFILLKATFNNRACERYTTESDIRI